MTNAEYYPRAHRYDESNEFWNDDKWGWLTNAEKYPRANRYDESSEFCNDDR